MKRTLICLALAVTALSFSEPVPKNFVKMYLAQDKQFAAGDWKGFFSNYSDNFTYTQSDGKTLDRKQFADLVRGMAKGSVRRHLHTQFTGCEITATDVKLSYWALIEIEGPNHKVAKYKEVAVDVWHSGQGDWKQVSTKDKSFGHG